MDWRSQLVPVTDYAFTSAYAAGKLTPAERAAQRDVTDLVAYWNKRMLRPGKGGRNKVRILTLPRFCQVRQLLAVFPADQLASGIDAYARSEWQRKNNAYMTFEHFFTAQRITGWIEAAMAEAERRAALAGPKDARVAGLAKQMAEKQRVLTEREELFRQLEAMPPELHEELLLQAAEELVTMGRRAGTVSRWQVRMQAMVILKRSREPGAGSRE